MRTSKSVLMVAVATAVVVGLVGGGGLASAQTRYGSSSSQGAGGTPVSPSGNGVNADSSPVVPGMNGNNQQDAATVASVPASMSLIAGTLHFNAITSVVFPPTELQGQDQTAYTDNTVDLTDATGSAAGWTVSLSATQFVAGSDPLPADSTIITGDSPPVCDSDSTCAPPQADAGGPVGVPAGPGATLPPPAIIFSADAGTGLGAMNFALGYDLDVPANASTGSYTATWVYTLSQGPATV